MKTLRKKLIVASLMVSLLNILGCAGISSVGEKITRPEPTVTSKPSVTVAQAQYEPSWGPKKRIGVMRFENKTSYTSGGQMDIGTGMAEQLTTALFQSGAFIVLERQAIDDIKREQDFGASGRVQIETAAQIGKIEGAELLIYGTVTEYEPGQAKVGGSIGTGASTGAAVGGPIGALVGGIVGTIAGAASVQQAHIAIDLRIVDANSGRVVNATSVQGKPKEVGGEVGAALGSVVFGTSAFYKTPIGQAVRDCINKAVDFTVKTAFPGVPTGATISEPPKATPEPIIQQPPTVMTPPQTTLPPQLTISAPEPPLRTTQVTVPSENLRAAPNGKIIGKATKGTSLEILEDKGSWLRVRLEDGTEAWIWKASTSEAPKGSPPPSPAPTAPKAKSPM